MGETTFAEALQQPPFAVKSPLLRGLVTVHSFAEVCLGGGVPAEFGERIKATCAAGRKVVCVDLLLTIGKTRVSRSVERDIPAQ